MDYWCELTLPFEEREKRVRKVADKGAQEALETLFAGKVEIKPEQLERDKHSDPATLNRFLALGLDTGMLQPPKPKKEN